MKLESVTLKGFRCYLDETTVRIGDLTALIGRNDVGKSAVLDALEIFFNNETVKLDTSDNHIQSPDKIVEITCEFSDLPDPLVLDAQAQTRLCDEYLLSAEGTLCIKKRFSMAGTKPKEEVLVCAHHPSASSHDDLFLLTNANLKKRLRDLKIAEEGVSLNSNPSLRRAIWSSCQDLLSKPTEISVAKEDGKRIWEQISVHLPMFALFQSDRASRDSDSEVQDPMKLAIASALAEVQPKLAEVLEAVKTKAVDLANRTHHELKKIDPSLARGLSPEFKADPKWAGIFSLSLNSEQGIPVNKRGSGVRRLILVSFFRAEAERRKAEGHRSGIIYAVEEPETSQHPINQRILLESLIELSGEDGTQVLISTHSPGLASYLPVDSLRFVEKSDDERRLISEGDDTVYQRIVDALGVTPDSRVRILLFVEGPTDVDAFKCLSRALYEEDPTIPDLSDEPRVAFVLAGGSTLAHWVNHHYLCNFGRPEVHIYDGDVAKYEKSCQEINSRGDGSWAVLTSKREIENYLHPAAILEGTGITVAFEDRDDVPAIVGVKGKWNSSNAKRKLAAHAFPKMTADLLRQRDPGGEVEGWFRRIGSML